jgi:predicted RNA-binding protein Jag
MVTEKEHRPGGGRTGGRQGQRRPGRQAPRRGRGEEARIPKIDRILIDVQRRLRDSIDRVVLEGLDSFERKRIHRFFERVEGVETRTVREGDNYRLHIIPVGNIQKLAREKAEEVLRTGQPVSLPPMGSYERYLVHTALKDVDGVETESQGEGEERHVEIRPKRFGRSLKRIIKKIRLF